MRAYEVAPRILTKKRPDGSVYTWKSKTFYLSYYKNRKKIIENTGLTEREEAKKWAENRMKRIDGDTLRDFLENHNWFSDTRNPLYLDANSNPKKIKYNYLYGQSQRNTRYLELIIKDIQDPIGDVPYNAIDRKEADSFRDRLLNMKFYTDKKGKQREVTTTFRNRVILSLSVIFNYYIKYKREFFQLNPFEKFAIPDNKNSQKSKFVFSPKQIRYMFNESLLEKMTPKSLVNDYKGKITRLSEERWLGIIHSVYFRLFKFIAYTGLRGNEACCLTVGQFDKDYDCRVVYIDRAYKAGVTPVNAVKNKDEIAVVGTPKSGKARTIVLCDEAYFAVADLLEGRDDESLVFSPKQYGKELSDSLFSNTKNYVFRVFINEIKEQFKIQTKDNEELTLHGFRTSLNSNLINKSSLRESLIAAYLGWTSKTLTNTQRIHYTHYDIDHLWEVASVINEMYSDTPIRWTPSKEEKDDLELDNIVAEIEKDNSELVPKRMLKKMIVELDALVANRKNMADVAKLNDEELEINKFSMGFLREDIDSAKKGKRYSKKKLKELEDQLFDLEIEEAFLSNSDAYESLEQNLAALKEKEVEDLTIDDYDWIVGNSTIAMIISKNGNLREECLSIDKYWPSMSEDFKRDLSH